MAGRLGRGYTSHPVPPVDDSVRAASLVHLHPRPRTKATHPPTLKHPTRVSPHHNKRSKGGEGGKGGTSSLSTRGRRAGNVAGGGPRGKYCTCIVVLTISKGWRRKTETYVVSVREMNPESRSLSSGFSRYSVGRSSSARRSRAADEDELPGGRTAGEGPSMGTTYGRYGLGARDRSYDIVGTGGVLWRGGVVGGDEEEP
jgi:hypothetical protein